MRTKKKSIKLHNQVINQNRLPLNEYGSRVVLPVLLSTLGEISLTSRTHVALAIKYGICNQCVNQRIGQNVQPPEKAQDHAPKESARSVYTVNDIPYYSKNKQTWLNTNINNKSVKVHWDTGATWFMINLETYHALGSPPVTATYGLHGYGNTQIKTTGECRVDVTLGNKTMNDVHLIIINLPDSTNLFGADWSDAFGLTEHGLSVIASHSANAVSGVKPSQVRSKIQLLTANHSEVFKPGLGHCTKVKIPLHLRENSKPQFSKPREIAFSKRDEVKREIDRLEGEEIDFSDWAAPIVCVKKPNNKIRICGDFKALTQQLHVDQHPIPKIDELMSKL